MQKYTKLLYLIIAVIGGFGYYVLGEESYSVNEESKYQVEEVPVLNSDELFTYVNDNVPYFNEEDMNGDYFLSFSELDSLGRTGIAYAKLDIELMPLEDRESIGHVEPSGWVSIKYDIVSGKYLYNRCHLIGFQLSGENANPENLITCTRSTNVEAMLPFENTVADYIEETSNSVMMRVTPIYEGDNLVASGIQMEAYSVEDKGEGVSFNIYIPNVEPGIEIDYSTGDSKLK